MLELTTRFRSVSNGRTKAGKRNGRASGAAAHLRYIDRESAVEFHSSRGLHAVDPDAQKAELRAHFRAAEATGAARETGARIAEKMIISLPADWNAKTRQVGLERLLDHLAPEGSKVRAWGVVHDDKPDNPHIHIIAQDGDESRASARARAAADGRKRARRQRVLRLGEKHRAKELRAEIAAVLNAVADERGGSRVEHKSFAERGIEDKSPMRHEGPERRARVAKSNDLDAWLGFDPQQDPIATHNAAERSWRADLEAARRAEATSPADLVQAALDRDAAAAERDGWDLSPPAATGPAHSPAPSPTSDARKGAENGEKSAPARPETQPQPQLQPNRDELIRKASERLAQKRSKTPRKPRTTFRGSDR